MTHQPTTTTTLTGDDVFQVVLSPSGQMTVSADLRERLRLTPGQRLFVALDDAGIGFRVIAGARRDRPERRP